MTGFLSTWTTLLGDVDLVGALGLGLVHRLVRLTQELFLALRVVGKASDPDAGGETRLDPLLAQEGVGGDGLVEPFGQGAGRGHRRLRQDPHELVAAVTGQDVHVADALHHDLGQLGQALAAHQVAVLVVDPLELVEVEKDQRHDGAVTPAAARFPTLFTISSTAAGRFRLKIGTQRRDRVTKRVVWSIAGRKRRSFRVSLTMAGLPCWATHPTMPCPDLMRKPLSRLALGPPTMSQTSS